MPRLKRISVVILWFLLFLAIWKLLGYVHDIWHTAANWAIVSLLAAEAVAVVVFVGSDVLRRISCIGSVPTVIHRMAAHIVLPLGITIFGVITITSSHFHFPKTGALAAEREIVQNAMIMDKNITTVTPNDDTNNSLGVNTWTALPNGPDAASLDSYLRKTTTHFFYCWDGKGNVYAQNKEDGVRAKPKGAEKQRPCRKAPQLVDRILGQPQ